MGRPALKRVGFAVLGALAAACAILAVGSQLERVDIAALLAGSSVNWLLPLVVGVSVGLFIWLAAADEPHEDPEPPHEQASCPVCGRPIMCDWRLCPECGTLVDESSNGEQRGAGAS